MVRTFLEKSIASFTFDPWSKWISDGGSLLAFPYGYAMWFTFCPLIILFNAIGIPIQFAYEFTLLIADVSLLLILTLILPGKNKLILISYWLSPIVILASYFLGFNDLIPTLFIIFAMLLIKRKNFIFSGFILAMAISAKLSMIISLPFFLIYFYNNKSIRIFLYKFGISFLLTFLFLGFPILFSNSAILMIFNNPEMGKVLKLTITLGDRFMIYIIPLIYLLLIYFIWIVRRINFELFLSVSGIIFLIIVLLTPASPGWFIWSIPFLAFYQASSGRNGVILVSIFSALYVFNTLLHYPLQFSNKQIFLLSESSIFLTQFGIFLLSLFYTVLVATGFVLAIRILRGGNYK